MTDTTFTHLQRYTRPQNYFGATWEGYYVFLGRNRDSDDLTNSNFEQGLAAVKAVASTEAIPDNEDESATVQTVCENHWACGWIEWIAIHESDLAALNCAEALLERLENYPVLNEEDWTEREMEHANSIWQDCYDPAERVAYIRKHRNQFEFHGFSDLLACVRGKYFAGYAAELIH